MRCSFRAKSAGTHGRVKGLLAPSIRKTVVRELQEIRRLSRNDLMKLQSASGHQFGKEHC